MKGQQTTDTLVAAILNGCWLVRHYQRGGRTGVGKLRRAQAILALGLVVREAFERGDDFEALLCALVDGLRPRSDEPPF